MSDRYPVEDLTVAKDGARDPEDDGTMPENVERLASEVVGQRIVSVERGVALPPTEKYRRRNVGTRITLDSGKQVFLVDTDDCCAYTELEAFFLHPELVDHVIIGVGTTDGFTRWHVYADAGDVLELTVGWSSGNPFYYGYGFEFEVIEADEATA